MNKNAVWVVIAAYNEQYKIEDVVHGLKKEGYTHIVVVDDGSKDATGLCAEKAGAHVLRHCINRGQGASLKTGMDFALQNNAEYIVTFDADGQHEAAEIEHLLLPLEKKQCEIALGSRFLEKKQKLEIPRVRKLILKTGAWIIWLFYGIRLSDSHNGFRAMTADAAAKLNIHTDRMEHASEIIERIAKNNIQYKEIPVTIHYTEYSMEKGQRSYEAFRILWTMIKNKILR